MHRPTSSPALAYNLDLQRLAAAYSENRLTPSQVIGDVLSSIDSGRESNPAWIHVIPGEELLARAAQLQTRRDAGEHLPLYGVPFAVKDNIDVAAHPTTAACPAFRYVATESAHAVVRLEEAGAICIGKTNMDQFATGLVGTRSPYGACRNPFNADYISGGSSAGSAVAVSLGQVSFALGTDTAGSGRVPAGFCNVVGLKPTRGLIGASGVVPACRSLDCVSIFALTAGDAATVLEVMRGADERDPYSRIQTMSSWRSPAIGASRVRCGVPRVADLEWFGDVAAAEAFGVAIEALRSLDVDVVAFDYTPFSETPCPGPPMCPALHSLSRRTSSTRDRSSRSWARPKATVA